MTSWRDALRTWLWAESLLPPRDDTAAAAEAARRAALEQRLTDLRRRLVDLEIAVVAHRADPETPERP